MIGFLFITNPSEDTLTSHPLVQAAANILDGEQPVQHGQHLQFVGGLPHSTVFTPDRSASIIATCETLEEHNDSAWVIANKLSNNLAQLNNRIRGDDTKLTFHEQILKYVLPKNSEVTTARYLYTLTHASPSTTSLVISNKITPCEVYIINYLGCYMVVYSDSPDLIAKLIDVPSKESKHHLSYANVTMFNSMATGCLFLNTSFLRSKLTTHKAKYPNHALQRFAHLRELVCRKFIWDYNT